MFLQKRTDFREQGKGEQVLAARGVDAPALVNKSIPVPVGNFILECADFGGDHLVDEVTNQAAVLGGGTEQGLGDLLF